MNKVLEKISKLEYHQKLLLKIIDNKNFEFYKLIVDHSLGEKDVTKFYRMCETLSKELEEQKAEGFVYFHPLYNKFISGLHDGLRPEDVVQACKRQGLFLTLMEEFSKYQ
ncbi:DUF1878 family protein [Cytobacillus depressus]|nr:DUF1878 family protein [Cytobacillus depressus]